MQCKLNLLIGMLIILMSNSATAMLITHENVLEIRFEFAQPFEDESYNLLQFNIIGALIGPGEHLMELYDGDTLIGSSSGPENTGTRFRAFGAPPFAANPAEANFSSIWDGSINGLLRYTFKEGSGHNIVNMNRLSVSAWVITSPTSSQSSAEFQPTISSVRVVSAEAEAANPVPSPASLYLALVALMSMTLVRKTA